MFKILVLSFALCLYTLAIGLRLYFSSSLSQVLERYQDSIAAEGKALINAEERKVI